jgi:hypothetical protein
VCWVTHSEGLLLHEGCEAVLSSHLVDDLSGVIRQLVSLYGAMVGEEDQRQDVTS